MVHFFSKNEMILIALMISLLDINNLCNYAIPHILYPNKRNYIVYFIVLITLIIDIYMYYTQINETISPDYNYIVVNNSNEKTGCGAYVKNLENQIGEWKNICSNPDKKFRLETTKIMLLVLAFFIIGITIVCFMINKNGTNTIFFKFLFTFPLMIIAICLIIYSFIDVKKIL